MNVDTDLPSRDGITSNDVMHALESKEIFAVYQPQVQASQGHLVGFEVLARWQSPKFGAVPADIFVPIAEQSGQIAALWMRILDCVEKDRAEQTDPQQIMLHSAVNLSTSQLQTENLSRDLIGWLKSAGLDASQLHVELTESALLELTPVLQENLEELRVAGIAIWLDDFGTGYSSLRHLRDLPISGLKIDKSFVDDLETSMDDFRIVSAIIAMSNSLGLQVVAEGVEKPEQAQMLTQLGCDVLQGYLIGKPGSLGDLCALWGQRRDA